MKKILVFVLVIILGIIGYIIFNNLRNRPERFIQQISATAEVVVKAEEERYEIEMEQKSKNDALKLFPEWWPKGRLN